MNIYTILAIPEFRERGAGLCVVIPRGVHPSLTEIMELGAGRAIIGEEAQEDAGDDLFVVQIDDGQQQALERDPLEAILRNRLAPDSEE
jgi:hypothetical protein